MQSIHPKQNQNQIIHESNKLCTLQPRTKKTLEMLKIKVISSALSEINSPRVLNEER